MPGPSADPSEKEVVFLHYSVDAAMSEVFHQRLGQAGVGVWEHRYDMAASEDVQQEIIARIEHAQLVLLCVSDLSVNQDWFHNEWAWCQARMFNRRERLLLYRVGELTTAGLPPPADAANFFDLTFRDPAARMAQAIDHIRTLLGHPDPATVTCGVIAMTRPELGELLADAPKRARLEELLDSSGGNPADLETYLGDRYGDSPQELRPFAEDRTIVDVVWDMVPEVNRRRDLDGQSPIHPVWLSQDLASTDNGVRDPAVGPWASGDSLLFVDGASLLHPEPARALSRIPTCDHLVQCGVVWLPPFTRFTERHSPMTDKLVSQSDDLRAWFRAWCKGDHLARGRALGFDFTLPGSLDCWVFRALSGARGEGATPNPATRAALGGGGALGDMFGGGPR